MKITIAELVKLGFVETKQDSPNSIEFVKKLGTRRELAVTFMKGKMEVWAEDNHNLVMFKKCKTVEQLQQLIGMI